MSAVLLCLSAFIVAFLPGRCAAEAPVISRASFAEFASCPLNLSPETSAEGAPLAKDLSEAVRQWKGRCMDIIGYKMPLVI